MKKIEKISKDLLLYLGAAILTLFCLVGAIRYSFQLLLPIIVAFAVAAILLPISRWAGKRLHLPAWLTSLLLTLLFYTLLFFGIRYLSGRLLAESKALFELLLQKTDFIFERMEAMPGKLFGKRITANAEHLHWLHDTATGFIGKIGEKMSEGLANRAAAVAAALPDLLLFIVTALLGTFYAILLLPRATDYLKENLPQKVKSYLSVFKQSSTLYLRKVLTATGLLFILTFLLLLFGFWILGFSYPFTPALLIAILDVLPVFGVGAALIPMAIYHLLIGKHFIGIGLFILYAAISLLHQILLPHLFGKENGIPPLLTLTAMYAGYRLSGFIGLIFGPFVALLLVTGYRTRNWKQSAKQEHFGEKC